jgi:zinc transport system substrate-binding protein
VRISSERFKEYGMRCNLIQKEVDVEIIYLDPLTRGEYKADSYLDAMGENIERIKDAIRK